MLREVKDYICKECGRAFSYAEKSYRLKGEKGEDRPERCQECRELHRREISKIKLPYFPSLENFLSGRFSEIPQQGYTFQGHRDLKSKENSSDWSGMKISITSKDIKDFYQKLRDNQIVIVVGQTGSGKSTTIPRYLLEPPENYNQDFNEWICHQGQIIVTQPLIAATEFISKTIAEKSGYGQVGKGQVIGYRHGSEFGREGEKLDDWNLLGFATDGSLRNWLREGKIGQYSLVMIDEAHQRTLNIDSLLMFLKNELPKNPSLRVIISSATIDTKEFIKTFEKEGISVALFEIPAVKKERRFIHFWQEKEAVKDEKGVFGCNCWLCQDPGNFWQTQTESPPKEFEMPTIAANFTLRILKETKEGSILIFLQGEGPIKECAAKIRNRCSTEINVIEVYRRLGSDEVLSRFADKSKKRRVIIATNIAETSHTLDDVVYEIESGLIKESFWDPETQIATLPTKPHSQDGRRQRWGRVGRIRDGYVYCLYTKEQFEKTQKHNLPEVVRSNLEEVFLTLKSAGLLDPKKFPWIRELQKDF